MKSKFDLSVKLGIPPLPSYNSDTIAALLWAREVLQNYMTETYAVKSPKGIEELRPIRIGGVDQWLHIRGRDLNNPVLLDLHGGPGCPNIGFLDSIQRPWEDYFTVVQWDQRQTGKSYYPVDDENTSLTVSQFIEDTEEVIQYLLNYFNQEKLFVLGHSWGTVLGMHMAKRHPDWLHAYIGIGQVVNGLESERVVYERLLSHAKHEADNKLVAKLESIIALYSDPDHTERVFVENCWFVRKELSRLAGEAWTHHMEGEDGPKAFAFSQVISPHLTLSDISNSVFGDEAAVLRSPYTFTKDFLNIDLPNELGTSFEVPIFFFTGAHDWQTPRSLSDDWFSEITAPHKEIVHFEDSSHVVVNEEPGKFLVALINKVLPFAHNGNRGEKLHA